MDSNDVSRRDLMSVLGMAAGIGLLASPVSAQPTQPVLPPLPSPEELGKAHGTMLEELGKILGPARIDSLAGIELIIDFLEKNRFISPAGARLLKDLMRLILGKGLTIDLLLKELEEIAKRLPADMDRLTATIVQIALNSARSAIKFANDHPRAVYLVAVDVLGAISGGAALFPLGPTFAVIGALGGGLASSAKARYGPA